MSNRDIEIITKVLRPFLNEYEITDALMKIESMINKSINSIDKLNN